ncbi:sugar kinase [Marimonas arenosa]|uniref:Sugar kinase n=1 Tax=Marimonas arenosa TaxID=1795305 RepID=A0AAE3WA30_9RHOB|nr:sugar kinase [Marimonas arenosa]MDQ2088902.1 sugar kinase [Marimonas arenosa]
MTEKRFLSIGECMIELAQTGPDTYRRGFAGDTFNTAWYARHLLPGDWHVGYFSAVGEDAVSDEMGAFITAAGIETDALRRVPDRTVGLYMISVEAGERSFSYWRSQSAARLLAEDEAWLSSHIARASALHFSGITLAILPPEHRDRLCAALTAARDRGAMVSFDTNLRPRLWESSDAMKAGLMQGAAAANLVLPSFDEEAGLFGDATPQATTERYLSGGATTVVVKNGAAPITLTSPETGLFTLSPTPVRDVVDSTAAGDSFAAALVAGLVTGAPLREAAGAAMRLAARVIRHPGALVPGIFTTGDLQ